MKYKGIDISHWQNKVDFSKVKKAGIQFVIICEGYRQTTDPRFFEYVEGCRKNNIKILGIYHFSYALNADQAKQEAEFCINNLKKAGLPDDTLVFFDFEYDTVTKAKQKGVTLGSVQCNLHTKVFCETVESLGYTAGVYFNQDYYKRMYDHKLLDKYVKWFAHYTTGSPAIPCTVQQFSSKGSVSGISGNVDMDWYFTVEEKKEGTETMTEQEQVLDIARGWIGSKESDGSHKKIIDVYNSHKPLARGYKLKYTDSWCAGFVSAVAIKAGLTDIIPTEVSCEYMIRLFKKLGEWVEDDNHIPAPAQVIFYDWQNVQKNGDTIGWSDHVGYVESCDGKTIVTIEGNYGDQVKRRQIPVGYKYIRGYGVPKYAEKIKVTEAESYQAGKTTEQLAREVIAGKWGNGSERKRRLTSAGYDYQTVQNKVNELLK